jgi:hypothetical protein
MDETATVALVSCPTCGHPFDPHVMAESSRHLPLECHCDCCHRKPACYSCREAFCLCADH